MSRPGKLDQRITLQSYTEVADGGGGSTKTWADFAATPTMWAQVTPKAGTEALDADRTNATATYEFTIRNRQDVDERHRIIWRDEAYNIRSVLRPGGRAMYLVIVAERGAPT